MSTRMCSFQIDTRLSLLPLFFAIVSSGTDRQKSSPIPSLMYTTLYASLWIEEQDEFYLDMRNRIIKAHCCMCGKGK
jgi:hypothetical protein